MNRCTEVNQLMGREGSICYLLFHDIWIVTIFAVSSISVLGLFLGDVKFLLSFSAGLCKICNDNTLSYVFFSVVSKYNNRRFGQKRNANFFLDQMFAIKCGLENCLDPLHLAKSDSFLRFQLRNRSFRKLSFTNWGWGRAHRCPRVQSRYGEMACLMGLSQSLVIRSYTAGTVS